MPFFRFRIWCSFQSPSIQAECHPRIVHFLRRVWKLHRSYNPGIGRKVYFLLLSLLQILHPTLTGCLDSSLLRIPESHRFPPLIGFPWILGRRLSPSRMGLSVIGISNASRIVGRISNVLPRPDTTLESANLAGHSRMEETSSTRHGPGLFMRQP